MMANRLTMNPYAIKLLRPITTMFMVTSIVGTTVAVAEPYKDALAAWRSGEYATAYRLWEPLADQGNPDAQFYLGFMNEYGQGVARNSLEAIRWYRKAADQDHAFAQFRLGDLYSSGEGSPPNDSEAAQWYRLAADQGLGGAQFDLGMMYAKGKGVPQDLVVAHMWLNLVVSELPPLGKQQRNTTVDALNLVAAQMSPSQVAEAQESAFQWLTEHRHRLQQKALRQRFADG
jgi:TPR repeat protein